MTFLTTVFSLKDIVSLICHSICLVLSVSQWLFLCNSFFQSIIVNFQYCIVGLLLLSHFLCFISFLLCCFRERLFFWWGGVMSMATVTRDILSLDILSHSMANDAYVAWRLRHILMTFPAQMSQCRIAMKY